MPKQQSIGKNHVLLTLPPLYSHFLSHLPKKIWIKMSKNPDRAQHHHYVWIQIGKTRQQTEIDARQKNKMGERTSKVFRKWLYNKYSINWLARFQECFDSMLYLCCLSLCHGLRQNLTQNRYAHIGHNIKCNNFNNNRHKFRAIINLWCRTGWLNGAHRQT